MERAPRSCDSAPAEIGGETLVVRSREVVEPIAVRYAYDPVAGSANPYHRRGLPASPSGSRPELLRWEPGGGE